MVPESLSNVDCQKAKASVESDESRLKELIESTVGFHVVDQKVKLFLIEWIAHEVQNFMVKLVRGGSNQQAHHSPSSSRDIDIRTADCLLDIRQEFNMLEEPSLVPAFNEEAISDAIHTLLFQYRDPTEPMTSPVHTQWPCLSLDCCSRHSSTEALVPAHDDSYDTSSLRFP